MNNNLYGELCFYENLLEAFRKAAKGKSDKWYVMEFRKGTKGNLLQLQKELVNQTYRPEPLKTFVIRDPKTRVISASAFRDRIVHHALCNIIEPIFEKSFIHDSYANRKGKGTHAALKRFDYFKRKASRNGKLINGAKDKNMVTGYCLKADIKHYFDSVDHEVLMEIIGIKIKDEKVLSLIRLILDNHCKKQHDAQNASRGFGKGMPIGNLTSQFFANVYLNGLDHFIKRRGGGAFYIRYVDDFVILHRGEEFLIKLKSEINEFLKTIKVELHPDKSKIYPLHSGINFLGFRIFYHYKLPCKRNLRHFRKKLSALKEVHAKSEMNDEDMKRRIDGWLAYASWANTYKLRRKIIEETAIGTPVRKI